MDLQKASGVGVEREENIIGDEVGKVSRRQMMKAVGQCSKKLERSP
jgi:hypothetical protein